MCENVIATEEEAIDAPKCDGCGITMKEHISLRDMSEQVTFTAYPIEMAQTPKRIGIMYQAFDVILRGRQINLCARSTVQPFFFTRAYSLELIPWSRPSQF